MYGRSSKLPVANTCTTLGWLIAATARPSRHEALAQLVAIAVLLDRSLIATRRLSPVSMPRNTSPIEPDPIVPSTR